MTNLTGRPVYKPIVGGVIETLGKRTDSGPHPDDCRCKPCISRRNRKNGLTAQRKAAKSLGIKAHRRSQISNEESWGAGEIEGIRWEVKSSGHFPKFLADAIRQVNSGRSIGSTWKPGVILDCEGQQYAVLALDDLKGVCRSLAETGNAHKIRDLARQVKRASTEIEKLT